MLHQTTGGLHHLGLQSGGFEHPECHLYHHLQVPIGKRRKFSYVMKQIVIFFSLYRIVTKRRGQGASFSFGYYEYDPGLLSWETKGKQNQNKFVDV